MDSFRDDLREIDERIIALVNERYNRAIEARQAGLPVPELTASDLETLSLERLNGLNLGPMSQTSLQAIYREIISGQLSLVRPARVAFFGAEGSFTHLAALRKFGESVQCVSRPTVADVFDEVAKDCAEYGVVPVENSTEGVVTATFDLFVEANVQVYSEIYLRIHHYLMARCPREAIKVVYSHPQVLGQCRRWIQQNLGDCHIVEVSNTTAAAERAAKEPDAAALGGILLAEKYDLHVLASNVEDFSENITRFLVLSKQTPAKTGDDKTSLMFAIQDKVGALYDSLLPFKQDGVSLSMIQSRPSKRKSWDYVFFVDLLGDANEPTIHHAIDELSRHCKHVKILGTYPRAADPV